MDILLLEPPNLKSEEHFHEVANAPLCSHLFTGYVGGFIREKGYNVSLISETQDISCILSHPFDVLGVNLLYLWQRTDEVFELLRELKNKREFHLNLFGYYPTFSYHDILSNHHFVDSVTVGEPEKSFYLLAEALKEGNEIGEIPGIASRTVTGNISLSRGAVIKDLDSLPFPMRSNVSEESFFYMLGSRGCPFSCKFCYVNNIYGKHSAWRARSIENIVLEIEYLIKNYNASYFYFADANFLGTQSEAFERVKQFLSEVKRKKLKFEFGMECRSSDITEPILYLLKVAGLKNIFLGLESASDKALIRYRKYTSPEKNERAIHLVREKDISLSYGWIMFDSETTLDDLEKNFAFLLKNSLLDCPTNTAHLLYHKVWLFKGSPFFKKTEQMKTEYEKQWDFGDSRVSF